MTYDKMQHGFSLVEMMIALVLGTLVVAAIIGVFLLGNRSYREDDRFARMQENGRYALKVLSGELANAGFWGGLPSASTITGGVKDQAGSATVVTTLCGVTFNGAIALALLSQATASGASTTYSCIDGATFKVGTDVLLVQRVDTVPATAATIGPYDDQVFLRTDGFSAGQLRQITNPTESGLVAELGQSGTVPTLKPAYWRYRPHLYYIQDGATPALHRRHLCFRTGTTSPADCGLTSGGTNVFVMGDDLIADGVEQVRVFFGIDSDGDGYVNQFKANPTTAELVKAVNAKLYVLIRSPEKDHGYQDTKTYWLGDTCYNVAGSDGCTALTDAAAPSEPAKYHRRVLTTTVALRNPFYHNRYGS